MSERFAKRLLIVFSVAWMVAIAWFLFRQHTDPGIEALRQQQFDQKMNDCRGRFAERYDCTSALLRQQSWDMASLWTLRLLLLFGPPLAASVGHAIFWNLRERQREAERNRARLERLDHEAPDDRSAADDPPLREIDEIRRRADERRRAALQHPDTPGATPADEDHPATEDPPSS